MYIHQIKTAIIDRLRSKLTKVIVDDFPDDPTRYDFRHPVAALLVHYDSAEGQEVKRTPKFNVYVVTRSLDTVYKYLDAVCVVLNGQRITGHPLKYAGEAMTRYTDTVWYYGVGFEIQAPTRTTVNDVDLSVILSELGC